MSNRNELCQMIRYISDNIACYDIRLKPIKEYVANQGFSSRSYSSWFDNPWQEVSKKDNFFFFPGKFCLKVGLKNLN